MSNINRTSQSVNGYTNKLINLTGRTLPQPAHPLNKNQAEYQRLLHSNNYSRAGLLSNAFNITSSPYQIEKNAWQKLFQVEPNIIQIMEPSLNQHGILDRNRNITAGEGVSRHYNQLNHSVKTHDFTKILRNSLLAASLLAGGAWAAPVAFNVLSGIAISAGFTTTSQMLGNAATALTGKVSTNLVSQLAQSLVVSQIANLGTDLWVRGNEKKLLSELTHNDAARGNMIHRYASFMNNYNDDKTAQEITHTISNSYRTANDKLREVNKNTTSSLTEIYADPTSDELDNNYTQLTDLSINTKNIDNILPDTGDSGNTLQDKARELLSATTTVTDYNTELSRAIGFKIQQLEKIGVKVDLDNLYYNTAKTDQDLLNEVNKAISKAHGKQLELAFDLYKAEHSAAAPMIRKVKKVLSALIQEAMTENELNSVIQGDVKRMILDIAAITGDTKLVSVLTNIIDHEYFQRKAQIKAANQIIKQRLRPEDRLQITQSAMHLQKSNKLKSHLDTAIERGDKLELNRIAKELNASNNGLSRRVFVGREGIEEKLALKVRKNGGLLQALLPFRIGDKRINTVLKDSPKWANALERIVDKQP